MGQLPDTVQNYSIRAMHVSLQLLRLAGRRLSRSELLGQPLISGDLRLCRVHYRGCGPVAVLELWQPDVQTAEGRLAMLFEPVMDRLGNGVIGFHGVERGIAGPDVVAFYQEWLCSISSGPGRPAG